MSARLVAGAFAIALGISGASEANGGHGAAPRAARPLVVRISARVPAGIGAGHVSLVSTFGGTRWSLAAFCTGSEGRSRLSLVAVSEAEQGE
jgi:hypothetical protein